MDNIKIALVTGANKGIGFETSRELGKLGFKVILGARNETLGTAAVTILKNENIDAQFLLIDVTKQETIDKAIKFLGNQYGYIDVLINNAGVFLEKGMLPSELNMAALKATFDVNFFGIFAMTVAALPLLKKSAAGRIVNVSSGQGSLTRAANNNSSRIQLAYNSSKAAVNALTIQFAKELKNTSVKINSAAPGFAVTDMNEGAGTRTVEQATKIIVELAVLDENGRSGGFFEDAGEISW